MTEFFSGRVVGGKIIYITTVFLEYIYNMIFKSQGELSFQNMIVNFKHVFNRPAYAIAKGIVIVMVDILPHDIVLGNFKFYVKISLICYGWLYYLQKAVYPMICQKNSFVQRNSYKMNIALVVLFLFYYIFWSIVN